MFLSIIWRTRFIYSVCPNTIDYNCSYNYHCLMCFDYIWFLLLFLSFLLPRPFCVLSFSIKSSFQLRTYDPEGAIFYGDTKNGRDWFILSLKDGVPLMQISRSGVLVNVAGGPKLNDGRWHTVSCARASMSTRGALRLSTRYVQSCWGSLGLNLKKRKMTVITYF